MEECKLGCQSGRPWGDKIDIQSSQTSPIFRWNEIFSTQFYPPGDPDFYTFAERKEDILHSDENENVEYNNAADGSHDESQKDSLDDEESADVSLVSLTEVLAGFRFDFRFHPIN